MARRSRGVEGQDGAAALDAMGPATTTKAQRDAARRQAPRDLWPMLGLDRVELEKP